MPETVHATKRYNPKLDLPGYELQFANGYTARVSSWPGGVLMSVYEPDRKHGDDVRVPELYAEPAYLLSALAEVSARIDPRPQCT